jgi:hypothetical protein
MAMTTRLSDACGGRGDAAGRPYEDPADRPSVGTDADLRAAGWQRCFVADEPRLSEAVETYQEIGFEVVVLPVRADEDACNECMRQAPDRFRVIYVRRTLDL